MRTRRLLSQFFAVYFTIGVVAMLLAGVDASQVARSVYLDEVASQLERSARTAGEWMLSQTGLNAGPELQAKCKELATLLGARITVISHDGSVVADSDQVPEQMENHANRPEVAAASAGRVGRDTHYSRTLGTERMYVAVPIQRAKGAPLVVRASVEVRTLGHALYRAYGRIAFAGVAMVAIVAVVSFWASRRILRPLDDIRTGAERLARGDLQHRLRLADASEVAAIAEALNKMASQLEERLRTIRRQENEQEAIVSSMEEGVLAVDASSRIINLNEACAKMLGVRAEAARGRLVHEVLRKREMLEFIQRAVVADQPIDEDLKVLGRPDCWFRVHGIALHDAERQRVGALIILHDVTRVRQLENVRRDFVANVSHELKTPITSIKGFVETLLDESLGDRENAERFLKIVLRQANRLDAIIEDLLCLSRIERGAEEQTIPLAPAPLADVLHSAAEMCEKKAADKRLELVVDCPADLSLPMNSPLVEQAIVNLIDNAVKYSPGGTGVRIEAEREEGGVVIRVTDEGCGIASEHLPRLFERFYRVDKARSRELGGTGLGLAIVKHIVAAHRGSVEVQSTVGKGTTFLIHLPAPAPGLSAPVRGDSARGGAEHD